MTRYVDHTTDRAAVGLCIVLPGRKYTPDGPLLFFAAQVALMRGWDVRQVWWDAQDGGRDADEVAWAGKHLDAAAGDFGGPVLVVGKSLGTLAAARAAERGWDAAWLTPLLTDREAAAPLLAYPVSQFVLAGSSDPYLSREVLDALPGTQLVVAGDHLLRVPGDAGAMVASHEQFVRAFDTWVADLRP